MQCGNLGKYRLDQEVGSGRTGTVYRAFDTELSRIVALKVFNVDLVPTGQLKREAEALAALNHPCIVQFFDAEYIGGRPVLAMEWVDGVTLRQYMQFAGGALPVPDALRVTSRLLEALQYAHARNMVHRDVKPLNILLGVGGTVKLADFGGAEMVGPNQYVTGGGTFAYMAPEDLGETPHSDSRSDLWAVGVILYEMVTGHLPFSGLNLKDPIAMAQGLRTMAFDPLPESLTGRQLLSAAISGALRPHKGARYQDAAEFGAWIADAARQMQVALEKPLEADIQAIRSSQSGSWATGLATPEEGTVLEAQGHPGIATTGFEEATTLETIAPASGRPATAAPVQARSAAPPEARPAVGGLQPTAVPDAVHFGSVRHGTAAHASVVLKADGDGVWPVSNVLHAPEWLHVTGGSRRGRRQRYQFTLHSGVLADLGEYRDEVVIETRTGQVRVPVAVQVLAPLRRFAEVADWLILVLVMAALPLVIGLVTRQAAGGGLLTAMLSTLLLRAIIEGDLGSAECHAARALTAIGLSVAGVALGLLAANPPVSAGATRLGVHLWQVVSTLVAGSTLLWLQGLFPRRWDRWTATTGIVAGCCTVLMVLLAISGL